FIALFTKYISNVENLREIFISRSVIFNDIIKFTGSIFIFLVNMTFFLTLYYHYTGKKIYISDNKKLKSYKKSMVQNIAKIIIIVMIIPIEAMEYSINSEEVYNSNLFYNTVAVAHRGGSLLAPENTLSALKVAIDSKAKYAEIDVQEAKDGTLVLTHDSNFKRTTKVNKNIWEATYNDILNYNASSYFNDNFKHENIPTLEDALKFCKNKIKLIIEIKFHGHEKENIVKKIIHLINENKMCDDCLIASNKKEILKEVKEIDSNIGTCYITLLAYGKFYDLDYIDVFAIEATFVNNKVVNKIHNEGKEIFVWTINKRDKMEELMDLNVNGIITDNPYLVLDALYWKENSFVKEVADYFFYKNV
ncbi:glycerophosphodiester phosphodiesterase family protein, partial [Clostridium tarantellae]